MSMIDLLLFSDMEIQSFVSKGLYYPFNSPFLQPKNISCVFTNKNPEFDVGFSRKPNQKILDILDIIIINNRYSGNFPFINSYFVIINIMDPVSTILSPIFFNLRMAQA